MCWCAVKKLLTHSVVCFCVATAHGKGVYFAKWFTYSAQDLYSPPDTNNVKCVFQCRVLTGHYHAGKPHLVEPPTRDKKSLSLYDSVVDNVKDPNIFVVFHDTQVYPEYLITFRYAWQSTVLFVVLLTVCSFIRYSTYPYTDSIHDHLYSNAINVATTSVICIIQLKADYSIQEYSMQNLADASLSFVDPVTEFTTVPDLLAASAVLLICCCHYPAYRYA